jgi:hypothetical protein
MKDTNPTKGELKKKKCLAKVKMATPKLYTLCIKTWPCMEKLGHALRSVNPCPSCI